MGLGQHLAKRDEAQVANLKVWSEGDGDRRRRRWRRGTVEGFLPDLKKMAVPVVIFDGLGSSYGLINLINVRVSTREK